MMMLLNCFSGMLKKKDWEGSLSGVCTILIAGCSQNEMTFQSLLA